MLKYLIDENVSPAYPQQLRQKKPELEIRAVGEVGTPAKSTKDPEILDWCAEYDFVLVTHNRTSMPVHLRDLLNQGRHVPGSFILSPGLSMGQNVEELILIADTTWKVSAPFGGANPHFFVPERKNGLF